MNYYERLSLLRLNSQALWLSDKTAMPVLVARATRSWTYVATLGCSSSMVGHLVTNRGCSLAWQMGAQHYQLYYWITWSLASCYTLQGIIDDTRYCVVGGDFDHRPLCLRLNIDYNFVEPQHIVETKKNCLGSNMINQKLKSINLP